MAPATAPGGPVGIVRVSGKDLSFLEAMVGPLPAPGSFSYRRIQKVSDSERTEFLDASLVLRFQAPHSFTGEDVLEIQGHGVPSILNELCECVCSLGARMALPGEFSFRAVMNGKMTLEQAESLQSALSIEGIEASFAAQLLGADGKFSGRVTQVLNEVISAVQRARGRVEAAIDFPEAETEQAAEISGALLQVDRVRESIAHLLSSYETHCLARGESRVAIAGPTNVGKSTLFNILCGGERAIVSPIAGTTRDVLETRVRLPSGRWVRILDTAGLRDFGSELSPHDKLEQSGIQKGREALLISQMVLQVRKLSERTDAEQSSRLQNDSLLYIYSHADEALELSQSEGAFDFIRQSSLARSWLLTKLDKLLSEQSHLSSHSETTLMSARQERLMQMASHEIEFARKGLLGQIPIELTADHLRESEKLLKKALGQNVGNEYIGEIFSQFCLGK